METRTWRDVEDDPQRRTGGPGNSEVQLENVGGRTTGAEENADREIHSVPEIAREQQVLEVTAERTSPALWAGLSINRVH